MNKATKYARACSEFANRQEPVAPESFYIRKPGGAVRVAQISSTGHLLLNSVQGLDPEDATGLANWIIENYVKDDDESKS